MQFYLSRIIYAQVKKKKEPITYQTLLIIKKQKKHPCFVSIPNFPNDSAVFHASTTIPTLFVIQQIKKWTKKGICDSFIFACMCGTVCVCV